MGALTLFDHMWVKCRYLVCDSIVWYVSKSSLIVKCIIYMPMFLGYLKAMPNCIIDHNVRVLLSYPSKFF